MDWVWKTAAVVWWIGLLAIGMMAKADEETRPRRFKALAAAWIFGPLGLVLVLIVLGVVPYTPISINNPYFPWIVAALCVAGPFLLMLLVFRLRTGRHMRREDFARLFQRRVP